MIPLRDLNAKFIRITGPRTHKGVDTIDQAHGVQFLCPKCFRANGGSKGTHSVICWSRSAGTPEYRDPKPGRWKLTGTSLHDLHLEGDAVGGGGARSVQLLGGCNWHGFINHGFAEGDLG